MALEKHFMDMKLEELNEGVDDDVCSVWWRVPIATRETCTNCDAPLKVFVELWAQQESKGRFAASRLRGGGVPSAPSFSRILTQRSTCL